MIYILYPRVNCLKTIPFAAAHTYIVHIWQYLPRGCSLTLRNGESWNIPRHELDAVLCCVFAEIRKKGRSRIRNRKFDCHAVLVGPLF